MPAEWEKQQATWLAWPHNEADWPDKFAPIPWVYAEIIRHLTQVQRVRLVVKQLRQKHQATQILERAGVNLDQVDFIIAPTNRAWLRDSGPTFVYSGKTRQLLDWHFNAWAKYTNWQADDKIPMRVEKFLQLPRIRPMHKGRRVVLEGGSIEVNGKGTLITTEECLISQQQCRNPGFQHEDYEAVFEQYLGIKQVVWLGNGIAGDDTHGHVDDITRFVNPTTVVTCVQKDKRDCDYKPLQENLKRLKAAKLDVIELPMPTPVTFEGQRLPASYANFLIANRLVLVPTFNDRMDRVALNILAELFPKRDVVGIYCGDFVWGLGTIHCASQQEIA
ncbi:MAG TPA: agmatine deiminase family protein [Gammaproteobacteria bacterium]|nr:agmatine deiminase family protein [Gammaproteobacteria bacterium]